MDVGALPAQALRLVQIGAIDLRVVLQFAWSLDTGVECLPIGRVAADCGPPQIPRFKQLNLKRLRALSARTRFEPLSSRETWFAANLLVQCASRTAGSRSSRMCGRRARIGRVAAYAGHVPAIQYTPAQRCWPYRLDCSIKNV
jgi:hypothetical protein